MVIFKFFSFYIDDKSNPPPLLLELPIYKLLHIRFRIKSILFKESDERLFKKYLCMKQMEIFSLSTRDVLTGPDIVDFTQTLSNALILTLSKF